MYVNSIVQETRKGAWLVGMDTSTAYSGCDVWGLLQVARKVDMGRGSVLCMTVKGVY